MEFKDNDIKPEEVLEYLSAIGALNNCTACHHKAWTVMLEPLKGFEPSIIYALPTMSRNSPSIPFPTLMVVCGNCGYCRQHIKMKFDQWRAMKKSAPKLPEE